MHSEQLVAVYSLPIQIAAKNLSWVILNTDL